MLLEQRRTNGGNGGVFFTSRPLYIGELIAPAGFQPSHRESFENVGLANVYLTVERSKADVSQ